MTQTTIQDIERKYAVETITSNGEQLWPFLRIYLGAKLSANLEAKTISSSMIKLLLSSFFYGFFHLFKRYDYLLFSSTDQRKINGSFYVDKSVEKIAESLGKSLMIEHPVINHVRRKKLKNKNVTSKSFFFLLTYLCSKFVKEEIIENESLLQKILSEYEIQIDYKALIKRNRAQYKATQLLAKWFKPKVVFVVCYYTHTGLIKALKEHNIKVVEIQHGLINNSHVAYTVSSKIDTVYFPDYLLTYGNNELSIFNENNFFIDPKCVIPVGHQYLDYISNSNIMDHAFQEMISGFDKIVCVTGQNHYIESKLLDFLIESAQLNPNIVYIYVPRHITNDYSNYSFPSNIKFANWLNCYEIIIQSNIHATVFSTCAIESLSLGVPNILIDIDSLSTKHLLPLLGENKANSYVETTHDFVQNIENMTYLSKEEIIRLNSANIIPDYNKNLIETLKKIVSLN
jgi:hypothetical protein